jgi:hypothetical protein
LDPSSRRGLAAVVPVIPVVPVINVVDIAELPQIAARVLIAVSDQAIELVAEALAAAGMQSGVVLHTCGARGPDALADDHDG